MALIENFVNRTLPDVFGCPLLIVEQAVFDSLRDWAGKTWTIRAGFSVSVSSLLSTNSAARIDLFSSIPDDHRVIALDDVKINGNPTELVLRSLVQMQDESLLRVGSFKYLDITDDTVVRIYPSVVGDIFDGEVICAPLESALEVPDILYDEWVEPIVAGAKWRLLSMPNKAWSNPDFARELKTTVRHGMLAANRRYNKNRTRRSLEVQPRGFGNG